MTDLSPLPADPDGLDFRFRVATSVLIEFALSHTPADVLRELVQNEYDAAEPIWRSSSTRTLSSFAATGRPSTRRDGTG